MGEFDMYRQAGTTPNFTDIARRYGMNRHTVAKYWKAGGQVEDARRCRPSGLDRHREVIEAKAQLPGATKRGIYEYLIDRCYAGEEPTQNGASKNTVSLVKSLSITKPSMRNL